MAAFRAAIPGAHLLRSGGEPTQVLCAWVGRFLQGSCLHAFSSEAQRSDVASSALLRFVHVGQRIASCPCERLTRICVILTVIMNDF